MQVVFDIFEGSKFIGIRDPLVRRETPCMADFSQQIAKFISEKGRPPAIFPGEYDDPLSGRDHIQNPSVKIQAIISKI